MPSSLHAIGASRALLRVLPAMCWEVFRYSEAAAKIYRLYCFAQNRRTDDPDEPDRSASFSIQRLSPGPRPAQPQAPKALQPQPPDAPEASFLDRLLESVLKGSASELAKMQASLELCVPAPTLVGSAQVHQDAFGSRTCLLGKSGQKAGSPHVFG